MRKLRWNHVIYLPLALGIAAPYTHDQEHQERETELSNPLSINLLMRIFQALCDSCPSKLALLVVLFSAAMTS